MNQWHLQILYLLLSCPFEQAENEISINTGPY